MTWQPQTESSSAFVFLVLPPILEMLFARSEMHWGYQCLRECVEDYHGSPWRCNFWYVHVNHLIHYIYTTFCTVEIQYSGFRAMASDKIGWSCIDKTISTFLPAFGTYETSMQFPFHANMEPFTSRPVTFLNYLGTCLRFEFKVATVVSLYSLHSFSTKSMAV